jgi:hypothetical protein
VQQGVGQTRAGRRDVFGVGNMVIGTGAEWLTFKLDRNAEFEADQVGTVLAAKAGYSVSGMIDVLQKLRARAGEPAAGMIFETHPHPSDRLNALGNAIEPQLATLPPGQEPPPPLEVAGSGLPAPVAGSTVVPAPGRGLTAEQQQQQAAPPPSGGSSLGIPGLGGSGSGSGGGIGPVLDGLFRRR